MPPGGTGARGEMGGSAALVLGSGPVQNRVRKQDVDLLTYGTPAPLGFDPASADRRFDYEIGRTPGFVAGVPGVWWTVNGHPWWVDSLDVADGDSYDVAFVADKPRNLDGSLPRPAPCRAGAGGAPDVRGCHRAVRGGRGRDERAGKVAPASRNGHSPSPPVSDASAARPASSRATGTR